MKHIKHSFAISKSRYSDLIHNQFVSIKTKNHIVQTKNHIVSHFKPLAIHDLYRLTQIETKNRIVQTKNHMISLINYCFYIINFSRKILKQL